MGIKVTNNAYGTLSASITSSGTTIALATGQGARFPTLGAGDYFYGTLIDTSNNVEIVKVTARSTDSMTVVRAQDNTTARAYSTNDRFELRPTAALFQDILDNRVNKAGDTMTGNLAFGDYTSTASTSPLNIDLGGTHSSVAGANIKLKVWNNGANQLGIGVHPDTLELVATASNHSVAVRTNGAQRLVVTPYGCVRLPTQPTFHARHTATEQPATNGVFTQWTSVVNIGGGTFSAGRYTIPANCGGEYLIHCSMLSSNNVAGGFHLAINGANLYRMCYAGTSSGQTYDCVAGQAILTLAGGDIIDIRQENGTVSWYGDSPGLGDFTIRMLG